MTFAETELHFDNAIKLHKTKTHNNNVYDKLTCILCNQSFDKNILKHKCKFRNRHNYK
jgi:hypothetical protein